MLIELQSLRDRFIRIVGWGLFTLTTKALDEAGDRISRYLLSLSLVNAGIGLAFGLGLLLLGVPYALLWGTGLALARFVPYVGVWPAAALPVALSLAASDGWTRPLLVVALFLGLELLANVVVSGSGSRACARNFLGKVRRGERQRPCDLLQWAHEADGGRSRRRRDPRRHRARRRQRARHPAAPALQGP